jgi:hypothetical protein
MKARVLMLLAVALLMAAAAPGLQVTPARKGAVKAPLQSKELAQAKEVEVLYGNGSRVVMVLQDESLDIVTEYGKLSIPPKDILYIEFGVHLPEGVDKKIADALKQLSSNNFKQRETAVKELVALGAQAYPALHQAAKTAELEVAQRIKQAIKGIEQKVPAKNLRIKEDDLIRTSKFSVVGRIVTPVIKAKAEYFGDLQLKPYQLRALRLLGQTGKNEVMVDAAKYGSPPEQWLNTEIHVEAASRLLITASGQVDLVPNQAGRYLSGPRGYGNAGKGQAFVEGMLIGKIGSSGKPFAIGERFEGRPSAQGNLYLHIVPSAWQNAATGSYQVKINVSNSLLDLED